MCIICPHFNPCSAQFHNHPRNIKGRKKGGKSFIKKENLGGQQGQWVLLFLPDWHLLCHFLVTPLPPQSTWFKWGANCRSKHVNQVWAKQTQHWDFPQSGWETHVRSAGLDSERMYAWASWGSALQSLDEREANSKERKVKRWKGRLPMISWATGLCLTWRFPLSFSSMIRASYLFLLAVLFDFQSPARDQISKSETFALPGHFWSHFLWSLGIIWDHVSCIWRIWGHWASWLLDFTQNFKDYSSFIGEK